MKKPRNRWLRWLKLKYIQLTRTKGGPAKVAKGFSVGVAVEMFTLPTGGLAFFLIFPLVWVFRASLASALIGFVLGKVIYIPLAFLNKWIGEIVIPTSFDLILQEIMPGWLYGIIGNGMDLIVGGMITGTILGILLYYPIYSSLILQQLIRKRKIRLKRKLKQVRSSQIYETEI